MDISQKIKMYRIHKIQSTELKKVNRMKGPSEDASVSLGREKKTTTSVEGGSNLRGKSGLGLWEGDNNLICIG